MARPLSSRERPGQPDAPILRKSGKLQLQPQSQYGPAMQALTPRWRRFVYNYLANGGRNATKAYMEAGFGGDQETAQPAASRLLHDSRIQAAIREETLARMNGHAPLAVHAISEILDDPTAAKKDRISAAKAILDRTGYMAAVAHKVEHTHTLNTEEMVGKITAMAKELGLDPAKLLGRAVVDGGDLVALPAPDMEIPPELEDIF